MDKRIKIGLCVGVLLIGLGVGTSYKDKEDTSVEEEVATQDEYVEESESVGFRLDQYNTVNDIFVDSIEKNKYLKENMHNGNIPHEELISIHDELSANIITMKDLVESNTNIKALNEVLLNLYALDSSIYRYIKYEDNNSQEEYDKSVEELQKYNFGKSRILLNELKDQL